MATNFKTTKVKTKYGTTFLDSSMLDLIDKLKNDAAGVGYKNNNLVIVIANEQETVDLISKYNKSIEVHTKEYVIIDNIIKKIIKSEGRFIIENDKIKYIYQTIELDYMQTRIDTIIIEDFRPNNINVSKIQQSAVIEFGDIVTLLVEKGKDLLYDQEFYKKMDEMFEKMFNFKE